MCCLYVFLQCICTCVGYARVETNKPCPEHPRLSKPSSGLLASDWGGARLTQHAVGTRIGNTVCKVFAVRWHTILGDFSPASMFFPNPDTDNDTCLKISHTIWLRPTPWCFFTPTEFDSLLTSMLADQETALCTALIFLFHPSMDSTEDSLMASWLNMWPTTDTCCWWCDTQHNLLNVPDFGSVPYEIFK